MKKQQILLCITFSTIIAATFGCGASNEPVTPNVVDRVPTSEEPVGPEPTELEDDR